MFAESRCKRYPLFSGGLGLPSKAAWRASNAMDRINRLCLLVGNGMSKADVITERTLPAIKELGTADILIAVLTFNNEETIGTVLRAAQTAQLQFSQRKVVIAQVDG